MQRDPGKRQPKWFAGVRGWLKGRRSASTASAMHHPSGQPLSPPWEPAFPGTPDLHDRAPRTLWRRFQRTPRRQQVGLAAGAGGLVLVLLVGIVVLCSHMPLIGAGTPSAAGVSGNASSTATARAMITTTPASSFTITFTCASGTIKGAGEVCVHTKPNTVLSISVRYCDGNVAGGKSLRGSSHADGSGNYTWRWSVRTGCAGTATATVTAKSAGETVKQSTTFTITRR